MIISASRRTDIPAYYSDWFFNRIREQYVVVRNPMNSNQLSKISLSPDVVDGIVFWTKNPTPMLEHLSDLNDYTYYFQFTLNPYSTDIEPNVPSKKDVIIPTFKTLSRTIGKERVIWRYDPILINERYTFDYHCKCFSKLAELLCDYTERCTVSFIDLYPKTLRNTKHLHVRAPTLDEQMELLYRFVQAAQRVGIIIDICSEQVDYSQTGVKPAHCVDQALLERLNHCAFNVQKDKSQRKACGCIVSIDIGAYNTCMHGCTYCYANIDRKQVETRFKMHNKASPLLIGNVGEYDTLNVRKVKSLKFEQPIRFINLTGF